MSPEAATRLAELRARIDHIDDALLSLVAERASLVDAIFALKRAEGAPLRDAPREQQIIERMLSQKPRRLGADEVEALVRAVLRASLP